MRREGGKGARREHGLLRRYAHLSTGNYNARTARLYTDLGCMTAGPELTADVDAVFQQLTGQVELGRLHRLLAAPFALQAAMLQHLVQVALPAATQD